MNRTLCWFSIIACSAGLLLWSSARAVNSQETVKPAVADPLGPARLKVETGRVVIEVTLKGTVEAEQTTEVSIDAKSWSSPLTVKSAVAHGTEVKVGDLLLELDATKIDQALGDLQLERELAEITLKLAREELPLLEQSLPLNLAATDRDQQISEEDFQRYNDIERQQNLKSADFLLKSRMQMLEYSREELKQLQKMYRDKDLTEETEEIILKRQKNEIEQIEFGLESLRLQQERENTLDRPRREQAMKTGLEKQRLAWKKALGSLPLELNQKRLALQKQETERVRLEERFQQLQEDRAAMSLRAAQAGIVYHGQAERGQWNTATVTGRLRRHGVIQPKEVVMTLIPMQTLFVRTDVEEKDLHSLKVELTGRAVPTGFPSQKLGARLASLSQIPRTAGHFDARIALDIPAGEKRIVPGMTATTRFVTYRNEHAVLVPTPAIFHDEGSDQSYVFLVTIQGSVKTMIETGEVTGNKTEVLSGLKAGAEILATRP